MFDPSTRELWEEIKVAAGKTYDHTKYATDILRRYTGRYYDQAESGDIDPNPENFEYSFVTNVLPALGLYQPDTRIHATRTVGHRQVKQAMSDGLHAWTLDTHYWSRTEMVRLDSLIVRGVTIRLLEEDGRFSRGSVRPAIKRISPWRFFIDPLADSVFTDEYRGHWYYAQVSDLLADPRLTPEARAALQGNAGDEPANNRRDQPIRKPDSDLLSRKRKKVYVVWLRQLNRIRIITEASEPIDLVEPYTYYGPPGGPYGLYDQYPVSNQVWPLSPLIACMDQAKDLNAHAASMARSAARRKSIGLVEATDPDLGEKLVNSVDGEIVPVAGAMSGKHVVVEIGGATADQYQYTEYVRQRLDRISGMVATVQGSVGDANTATEAQIASEALFGRIRYLKHKVKQAVEGDLWAVCWFMFNTFGIVLPVNSRDELTGEPTDGVFFGGPFPSDAGATWDDFNIEVELIEGDASTRFQEFSDYYNAFERVMFNAPTLPWVRSMAILEDLDAVFRTSRSKDWVVPEFFGGIGQPPLFPASAMMGQQQPPPQGGLLGPSNRNQAGNGRQPPPRQERGGLDRPPTPIGRNGPQGNRPSTMDVTGGAPA